MAFPLELIYRTIFGWQPKKAEKPEDNYCFLHFFISE